MVPSGQPARAAAGSTIYRQRCRLNGRSQGPRAGQSARDDDEIRAFAGLFAETLVGDDQGRARHHQLRKSGRSRPAGSRCGRAPLRGLRRRQIAGAASVTGSSRGRAVPRAGRCRRRALLRRLAGQRHDVPAECRAIVQIVHRRKDMRPERLLRMVDGDRRIEQRAKSSASHKSSFLAADEDRDRPLGRDVSGFNKRGRLGCRCRRRIRRRIERYRRRGGGAAQQVGRGGRRRQRRCFDLGGR